MLSTKKMRNGEVKEAVYVRDEVSGPLTGAGSEVEVDVDVEIEEKVRSKR